MVRIWLLGLFAASLARADDARPDLIAHGFLGISLDSFAARDLNLYLNPGQASEIKERGIGGVQFEYRTAAQNGTQLWLYGRSMHGARSAGVAHSEFELPQPNRTLYLIRTSTSLEAILGTRLELHTLRRGTSAPSSLYVKGQAGFLAVAGSGGGLVQVHHLAAGVIAKAGTFVGSYVEVGVGKTSLFPGRDAFPRMKIDTYLQWPLKRGLSGFAQMTVDGSPRGSGADSVQSYFGIHFDLRSLF